MNSGPSHLVCPGHAIRRASSEDADALARLRYDFRASIGEVVEDEDIFLQRCACWMRPRLQDDRQWRAWVIDDARGMPRGNIWLQRIEKIPNPVDEPEMHGYVTNFFVRPQERNAGAGTGLLVALLADCDATGVDAVFLWPTPRSVAFYERHGFASRNAVMVRGR
jgi:GNAT superfamily N-acetyltransferase